MNIGLKLKPLRILLLMLIASTITLSCKTTNQDAVMSEEIQSNINDLKQEFVQYSSEKGKTILYQPTKPVEDIKDPNIQKIFDNMKTHLKGKGIGLAANQIGVPLQIFINPKITAVSEEKMSFQHGCLSAVDRLCGLVATYRWIEYEAYDENGNHKTGHLDGLAAVIFRHEFRHLLGSLYINHAKEFLNFDELKHSFESGKLKPYETAGNDVPLLLQDYKIDDPVFK